MPTVPKLENSVSQNVTNLGKVNTQVDLGNEQIGSIFNQAAGVLQNEKDRGDRLEVMRVDRELTALETRIMYDKEKGAMFRKGKDAFNLPEETDSVYTEEAAKIKESLSNTRQKAIFDRLAGERKLSINRSIEKHVGNEIKNYELQETDAYIKTQRDYAITNAYEPEKVKQAVEMQKTAIAFHAESNGLGPEFIKQKTMDIESKTHAAVIGRMVNSGDDITAENYFNSVKDSITGDDLAAVEKDLEIATLRGKSQRAADVIWTNSKSYSQALEKTREIEDPKLRDATQSRINELNTQKKIQEQEQQKNYNIYSANLIDKTGTVTSIPPAIWQSMTTDQRQDLRRYADQRAQGVERQNNDPYVYDDLRNLQSAAPDAFLKIDLTDPKYLAGLKASTREAFVKEQAEMRNGKKGVDGILTDVQIMNDALTSIGVKNKDSDDAVAFRAAVDSRAVLFAQENGRKPNNKELKQITDELSVEAVIKRDYWFDSTKRLYQIKSGEKGYKIEIDAVPKAEKDAISSYLKRTGRRVDNESILEAYSTKLKSKGLLNE